MAEISVVMATYNETPAELQSAITSILRQSYSDFEFIIILDKPENQPLYQILQQAQAQDARIKLLVNEHNLGLAASLQKGCNLARGTWIARMDADDIALPERLAIQLAVIQERQLDVLSSNADFINEQGQVVGHNQAILPNPEQQAQLLPLASTLIHPSILMKRSSYLATGGYQDIPTSEDYELWLRFLAHGFRIGATNEVLLQYRIRQNSMTQGDFYKIFLTSDFLRHNYQHDLAKFVQPFARDELESYYRKARLQDPAVKARFRQRTTVLSQTLQALPHVKFGQLWQTGWFILTDPKVRRYALNSQRTRKIIKKLQQSDNN